ncbi:MAG: hypothetical protein IPK10_04075 [Bacteroidetes bacterium]|nr:hypothetical protein [Bacteroidota bacterium]
MGVSWASLNTGLNNLYLNTVLVDGANIFVGTNSGILHTNDNGITWTTMNSGLDVQ